MKTNHEVRLAVAKFLHDQYDPQIYTEGSVTWEYESSGVRDNYYDTATDLVELIKELQ